MDDNKKIIREELLVYSDTIVIVSGELYVLRGWYEETNPCDMDYYYILQNIKGEFQHHSFVGGFIPLKGYIKEDDYNRLKNHFQFNLDLLAKEVK